MIPFASGRRIMSGVPIWRCLQQITRAPAYKTKAQLLFTSQASSVLMPSRPSSTNRLLSIRPVSWHTSRLCHGDSQGTSERGDSKEDFSLRAITKAPKPALYLGVSGLIPFLSAPLLIYATGFNTEVAYVQLAYGAAIVSFLGGARWGFAVPEGSPAKPDWMNLGNSVVPSLLAWLAMLCKDNIAEGVLVVVMGLGLSLYYDLTLLPGYPAWFKAMRTILTLIATLSLVTTLVLKEFKTDKNVKESHQKTV